MSRIFLDVTAPPSRPPRGPSGGLRIGAIATAIGLSLTLGACGSGDSGDDSTRRDDPLVASEPQTTPTVPSPAPDAPTVDRPVEAPDAACTSDCAESDVPAEAPPTPSPEPEPVAAPGGDLDDDPDPDERRFARWEGVGALPPLPSPPLTAPPGADSEPVPETRPVGTARRFFLVADPQGRIVDTDANRITDAEFDAGPLAPVVSAPSGIDVTGNTVPYFAGLSDRDVRAGEVVEIVLDPEDPDGGFPGMYPERLMPGAAYIDNLDGTRTVRWRPLQPDVGITDFVIVAVDAQEPLYRSARTVRIRVSLPDDPSSIPNLAPGINQVRAHVARVNDPVVMEIKGTDPNGTLPELALLNPPAGATFVAHRSEPGMRVLRFVPETAGTIELQVQARDADDPSLTLNKTFTVDVLEPEAFTLPGERLRSLGARHGVSMGFAALQGFYARPDGALYADLAAAEYDLVSAENSMKPDSLNPLPGVYRWAAADNLVAWAGASGLGVHGHTLVWYRQLPGWMKRAPLELREGHMREFIDRVMRRYRGRVDVWDVVNESLEDDGSLRNSVWHQAMGERYIDIAFRQARQSDPDATLLYNEYDVAWAGPKAEGMFDMLERALARGVPIDGVGFQLHVYAAFDAFDEVRANFARAAALGLDVYVTELDVSITDGASEADQALVYERLLGICLESTACKGFQTWGYTDMYSWRRAFRPLPFDERYAPKPAYLAMQQRLAR